MQTKAEGDGCGTRERSQNKKAKSFTRRRPESSGDDQGNCIPQAHPLDSSPGVKMACKPMFTRHEMDEAQRHLVQGKLGPVREKLQR